MKNEVPGGLPKIKGVFFNNKEDFLNEGRGGKGTNLDFTELRTLQVFAPYSVAIHRTHYNSTCKDNLPVRECYMKTISDMIVDKNYSPENYEAQVMTLVQ